MKQRLNTAYERAKASGNVPGALKEFFELIMEPQVKWTEHLRTAVSKSVTRDTKTWRRPHRRRIYHPGIYMPSRTGFGAGTIVVGFDTSGSVSKGEIEQFFGELSGILTTTRPRKLILIYCDSHVQGVEQMATPGDLINVVRKGVPGRGGTRFQPVFDYIDEHMLKPDTCIYLTDLYPCDKPEEPDYPVIWCSTGAEEFAWGEVVKIDA